MTVLVVSLSGGSADAMLEAARRSDADLFEARLDLLKAPTADDAARLVREAPRPVLLTVRSREEGGAFPAGEREREALLLAAIEAAPFAVDVESGAACRDRVLAAARARGVRVVLSAHDLAATPPADDLLRHLRAAAAAGAWVGKYAVTLRGPDDAAALVRAAAVARREGLSFALMAVNDAVLRLVAPLLGASLVYGRPDDAAPVAPGQVAASELRRVHARLPTPTPATRPILLLGHPVAHSASPAMQNAALRAAGVDAVYLASDVEPGRLGEAVRALPVLGAVGANVTIPHKEAVLAHVDEVAASARAAGAANTLVVREGRVAAHDTDGPGALAALREADVRVVGARALVLGAGGAARAVAHTLRRVGASVTLHNRTPARAEALAEAIGGEVARDAVAAARGATLLVNATSVGLRDDALPIADSALRADLPVLDCVYRKGGTALARAAVAAGARVVPGETMLLHQGAAAFTLWTGKAPPLATMRAALDAALGGSA